MKVLKSKIQHELKMLEKREDANEGQELSREALDRAYRLSKALVYLHKACDIMDGKHDGQRMGTL